MGKQKLIIVGSSGHAKVIIDICEKAGQYEIIGLLDPYRKIGEETLGYKIIGKEEDLPSLLSNNVDGFLLVAIGDNWTRKKVVDKILTIVPNVSFGRAIHPSAQIGKNVQIGQGTVIMAGAVVNSDTIIGDFATINTKASIDHDSVMSDFSSLAPSATTGGFVSIGQFSAVSIGATIIHGVSIGKHALIGAGAVLLQNCGDNRIMYGVPAKVVGQREKGQKYL